MDVTIEHPPRIRRSVSSEAQPCTVPEALAKPREKLLCRLDGLRARRTDREDGHSPTVAYIATVLGKAL